MSTVILCFYFKLPLSPRKSVGKDPGTSETQEQRGKLPVKRLNLDIVRDPISPLHLIQREETQLPDGKHLSL